MDVLSEFEYILAQGQIACDVNTEEQCKTTATISRSLLSATRPHPSLSLVLFQTCPKRFAVQGDRRVVGRFPARAPYSKLRPRAR